MDERKQSERGAELLVAEHWNEPQNAYCLGVYEMACFPKLPWISNGLPVPVPGRPCSPGDSCSSHKAQVFDFSKGLLLMFLYSLFLQVS